MDISGFVICEIKATKIAIVSLESDSFGEMFIVKKTK